MSTATERKAGRNRTTKAPDHPRLEDRIIQMEARNDALIGMVVNHWAERGDMARWRRTARASYQDIADYINKQIDVAPSADAVSVMGSQVALWEHCRAFPTAEQALAWATYLHNENGMEVPQWDMKF